MPVEEIHNVRDDQAYRQINYRDQQNDFNGATRLVDNRVADGEQIGKPDRDRERRVFHQIQKFTCHWWSHDSNRLR